MDDSTDDQAAEITSVEMSEPEDPRENLISTAVNFLKNPKVRGSPLSQKKAFLEKKGLTKAEVELAVSRSGITEDAPPTYTTQPYPGAPPQNNGQMMPYYQAPLPTTWTKIRDFTALTVVIGGVGIAVYRLYHSVIKPYLFGVQVNSIERQVLEMQEKMTETLVKVQEGLSAIQESLRLQEERINAMSIQVDARKTEQSLSRLHDSQFVSDLKSEVASIKGLLLNRRQFPPMPSTTPVLPSWQIAKDTKETSVKETVQEENTTGEQSNTTETQKSFQERAGDDKLEGMKSEQLTESTSTNGYTPVTSLVEANQNERAESPVQLNDQSELLKEPVSTSPEAASKVNIPRGEQETERVEVFSQNGVLAQDDSSVEVVN